jgi:hypothetical protein
MQFKKAQRAEFAVHWNENSWFYKNLGQPAREIVEKAYGLRKCTPRELHASQETLTTVMSVFARRIGAEKSHTVHALLTGSISGLTAAIGRKPGASFSIESIKEDWEDSFRQVVSATI